MKVGIDGLGKMGMQIARRLVDDGHSVVAHNRSPEKTKQAVNFGAIGAKDKSDLVSQFGKDQIILWLMITADAVEPELDEWLTLLKQGDIIIDGGNSDFRQTQKRAERAKKFGVTLLDIGTSGGILGLKHGFCMMIGGDQIAFGTIKPILDSLSSPEGSYMYFGASGSGHFVKMVHNAIEYGIMESLAEGYRMLKEGPYQGLSLAAAGEVWQHGSIIASSLNGLTTDALIENPELKGIDGYVAETGETRLTLEIAKEKQIDMPAIQAAFDVRLASQQGNINFSTRLLAAMRNKFGGHGLNKK